MNPGENYPLSEFYLQCVGWWHRWGRTSLGLILSGGLIIWLATFLDFHKVLLTLQQVNPFWTGVSLFAVLLTLWARVLRWQALLDSEYIPASRITQALVVGQLLNLILPARLGDLGRAHLVTVKSGDTSQAKALGTIAVEKLWDIVLLVGLVVALAFWHSLPTWITIPARLTAISGGAILILIVSLLVFRRRLSGFGFSRWFESSTGQWLGRITNQLFDGLTALHKPQVMVAAGGWSLLAWFFGGITNLALLKAFDLPTSIGVSFLLLAVLQLGVAIPSVPGRIGVFEGLCLATLALFGIEANIALGFGVLLHLIVLLPPVVIGLWWLLRMDSSSRRSIWKPAT